MHDNPANLSRRQLLRTLSCGFGYLAMSGLAAHAARVNPLAARPSLFAPRAKRVIFLFMQGGPSQVDTFDPKPRLDIDDGKEIPFNVARTRTITPRKVLRSPWKFKRHGQCGQWVSELLPNIAQHVDDLC